MVLVGGGFCSLKYEMNEFCPFVLSMPFIAANNIRCCICTWAFSISLSYNYQRVTKAHQNLKEFLFEQLVSFWMVNANKYIQCIVQSHCLCPCVALSFFPFLSQHVIRYMYIERNVNECKELINFSFFMFLQ